MSNEIVLQERQPITAVSVADTMQIGRVMAQSGFFTDVTDAAQAVVKVMAGQELGIGPFASMTGIHIIKGKPALGANIIATLIKNDPRYDYRVTRLDDQACTIVFFENGQQVGESTFTLEDAKRAGTQNLQRFPRNMLFARAISNGAKWYVPGIFGGTPVYTPDELGADVDYETGEIITTTAPPTTTDKRGTMAPDKQAERDPRFTKPTTNGNGRNWLPGEDVVVAGKNDEVPGTVVEMDGELVKVKTEAGVYSLKPDRLKLVGAAVVGDEEE